MYPSPQMMTLWVPRESCVVVGRMFVLSQADNRWRLIYFVATTQHTQCSRDASWLLHYINLIDTDKGHIYCLAFIARTQTTFLHFLETHIPTYAPFVLAKLDMKWSFCIYTSLKDKATADFWSAITTFTFMTNHKQNIEIKGNTNR